MGMFARSEMTQKIQLLGTLQDNQPGALPDSDSTMRTDFWKWDQNGDKGKEAFKLASSGDRRHTRHTLWDTTQKQQKSSPVKLEALYQTTTLCKSPGKLTAHRNEKGQLLRSNLKVSLKRMSSKLAFLKTMETFQKDTAIKKIKTKAYVSE